MVDGFGWTMDGLMDTLMDGPAEPAPRRLKDKKLSPQPDTLSGQMLR